MDSKETRIMKTDAKETAGSGGLMDEVRERLDELQELLEENYITESEYAAARTNVLLEVGVDIAVRSRAESQRMYRLEARSRRAGAGRDYGRFLLPAILVAGVLACAVFFFWTLTEGGLFSPRRNGVSSLLPPPTSAAPGKPVPPVPPALLAAEDLGEESGDEDGEVFVFSPASEDPEPAAAEPEASEPEALKPEALEPKAMKPEAVKDSADSAAPEAPVLPAESVKKPAAGNRALPGWAVVSVRRVRIRAAPDTSADNVLGWALKGERFAVLKEAPGRDGSKWYNVRYEKIGGESYTEGWIKASMMEPEE
jgi:hypothetical protein